jgi:hypothetical protein
VRRRDLSAPLRYRSRLSDSTERLMRLLAFFGIERHAILDTFYDCVSGKPLLEHGEREGTTPIVDD